MAATLQCCFFLYIATHIVDTYSKHTDEELTLLLQQGDHRAFEKIYTRYWGVLYIHACKMLKIQETAMDILQDIFTDLWHKRETLIISTSLRAYLYSAVRYKTLDALRRDVRQDRYVDSMVNFSKQMHHVTEEQVILDEFIRRMEAEVSQLPPRMRKIFELSRLEGKPHKHIAQELDITDHTVKKTLNRALKLLRSKLTLLACLLV